MLVTRYNCSRKLYAASNVSPTGIPNEKKSTGLKEAVAIYKDDLYALYIVAIAYGSLVSG